MVATSTSRAQQLGEANARLGTAFFLVAETVFFVGLVFAALAIRRRFAAWPPLGTPALDAGLVVASVLLLLASGATAYVAQRRWRERRTASAAAWLAATGAMGLAFLVGQLYEFQRLGGWRPADSMFRTLFDTLAWLHGVHVGLGLGLLAVVWLLVRRGAYGPERQALFAAVCWYWVFVAWMWPVLLAVLSVPS
jgi:cytochrome c oxidase subunit III